MRAGAISSKASLACNRLTSVDPNRKTAETGSS